MWNFIQCDVLINSDIVAKSCRLETKFVKYKIVLLDRKPTHQSSDDRVNIKIHRVKLALRNFAKNILASPVPDPSATLFQTSASLLKIILVKFKSLLSEIFRIRLNSTHFIIISMEKSLLNNNTFLVNSQD